MFIRVLFMLNGALFGTCWLLTLLTEGPIGTQILRKSIVYLLICDLYLWFIYLITLCFTLNEQDLNHISKVGHVLFMPMLSKNTKFVIDSS